MIFLITFMQDYIRSPSQCKKRTHAIYKGRNKTVLFGDYVIFVSS